MAKERSHLSLSLLLGVFYAAAGLLLWRLPFEILMLAGALVILAGLLPNIDAGPSSESGSIFTAFIAAVCPIFLLSIFPQLRSGGVARAALVIILSFFATRSLSNWALSKFVNRRGLLHSVPAAVIVFEITYLIFWDLFSKERLFLACGALFGFGCHLLLDATMNIDLVGNKAKKTPVLKLAGQGWTSTVALYSTVTVLAWFVLRDIYPTLRIYGGVHY